MAPRGIDVSMLGSRSIKPSAASNIPLDYDIIDKDEQSLGCLPPISCSVWTNMMFVVPVVLTLSIALGTSFYYFHEQWELSTCYYYASQVLNGNMFDTPSQSDEDHAGLWFTLLLYVYGSTLMASAYGAFASVIVENSFKLASNLRKEHHDECRNHIKTFGSLRNIPLDDLPLDGTNKYDPHAEGRDEVDDPLVSTGTSSMYGSLATPQGYTFLGNSDDGIIKQTSNGITTTMVAEDDDDIEMLVPSSSSSSYLHRLLRWLGWEEHKDKYRTLFATTLWLVLGVFYGVIYEGWGVLYALRFAIGTLSASGSPVPVCIPPTTPTTLTTTPTTTLTEGMSMIESSCQLGLVRGLFVGTYILIGVPLWAYTLGQFSMVIVERAVRRRELELMARPLTQQEFSFASKVSDRRSSSRSDDNTTTGSSSSSNGNRSNSASSGSSGSSSSSSGKHNTTATATTTATAKGGETSNHHHHDSHCEDHEKHESEVLDFGEFVVLEMLRLRRIDLDDLASMRAIFDAMDLDKTGDINYDEVKQYHMLTRGRVFNNQGL